MNVMLLLLAAGLLAGVAAQSICPASVEAAAANHFVLEVVAGAFMLPDNTSFPSLTFNGSYVGPALTVTLGARVTIDVYNRGASEGWTWARASRGHRHLSQVFNICQEVFSPVCVPTAKGAAGKRSCYPGAQGAPSCPQHAGTSVHWHGLDLPDASWSDGVAGIGQRPIAPGHMFRYSFIAQPAGTHWYHSHVGLQLDDGLHGPFIVRDPKDLYLLDYQEERLMFITDQPNQRGDQLLQALQKNGMPMGQGLCASADPMFDLADSPYYTLLVNGKGWVADPAAGRPPLGSADVVRVKAGASYRFRLVAATGRFALKLSIQGHTIDIIAKDGQPVAKRSGMAGLIISPGERVDFILKARATAGNYWIHVSTLGGDASPAVLSYEGAPEPSNDPALGLPNLSLGCQLPPAPGTVDLRSDSAVSAHITATPKPPSKPADPKRQYVMHLTDNAESTVCDPKGQRLAQARMNSKVKPLKGCPKVRLPDSQGRLGPPITSKYCWSINRVPFSLSETLATPVLLLNGSSNGLGDQAYYERVAFGEVVDVAFVNYGMMDHPMHLHGYHFWLLGSGNSASLPIDSKGRIKYDKLNSKNPPYMDTYAVQHAQMSSRGGHTMEGMPGMGAMGMCGDRPGWAVVRFKASNPGVWAMHCHTNSHARSGMFMFWMVANSGPKAPWSLPANVTRCGA